MNIVERLRDERNRDDRDIDLAANMLEFFFSQMTIYSPKMDGNHTFTFKSGGWPMNHCMGLTREDAVLAVLEEIQRERMS